MYTIKCNNGLYGVIRFQKTTPTPYIKFLKVVLRFGISDSINSLNVYADFLILIPYLREEV